MNALGASRDFRSLPTKLDMLKPARSAPPPKTTPPVVPTQDSAARSASTFSFKNVLAPSVAESKALDESEEAQLDEALSEQRSETPEDPNDLFDSRQALDESNDEPDPKEQRRCQARRLEMLEGHYRCQLLLVESLLERLGAANQGLTLWCDSTPTHSQYQTLQSV